MLADDWDDRIEREIARLTPTFEAIFDSVTVGSKVNRQDKEDVVSMIRLRCWAKRNHLSNPSEATYYFSRLAANLTRDWLRVRGAQFRTLYAEVSVDAIESFDMADPSTVSIEAIIITGLDQDYELSGMRNQLFSWLLDQADQCPTPARFEKMPYVKQVLSALGVSVTLVFDVLHGQSLLELV